MSSFTSWQRIVIAVLVVLIIACVPLWVVFNDLEQVGFSAPRGAGGLAWGAHSLVFIWEHNGEVLRRHAHQSRYWHRMWVLERDLRELSAEFGAIMVDSHGEVKASSWVEYRDRRRDVYWASDIAR
jgi:hypothetical protein